MKWFVELIKRQFCRAGLHRWSNWSEMDDIYQWRECKWCKYGQSLSVDVYTIGQILMAFATKKKE